MNRNIHTTDRLGVMIDMSRNAVMSMAGLRRFLLLLSKMGYNTVMLYTEDTYEIPEEPFWGYMRGRYTQEELKELDSFCQSLGMELVPCIQTLAHLNATIRWGTFPTDTGNILLTDDPRSYELIERMFQTASECFSTKLIHIGMDEAHMLGRGTHLDIHGYESATSCVKRHLAKVKEIGEKYGFTMMIWSDMFFRPWNHGDYVIPKTDMPLEVVQALPENIIPVYWDYYGMDKERYSDMIENHYQLSNNFWFAGGAWSWRGLVPMNQRSLDTMRPALDACREHGVKNIIFTMWGDNGGECSHFSQLPVLFYLAEYARGNTDEEEIIRKFRTLFNVDFADFMALDLPNRIGEISCDDANPSKYMLLCDYFNGIYDASVNEEGAKRYAAHAETLETIADRVPEEYRYLFDTEAKLCQVLAVKYDLGVRTRAAYQTGDRAVLRNLAQNDYSIVHERIRALSAAMEKQWFLENKTSGFDIQDIRLGGLLQRTESCRRRLLAYADGEIDRIEELETTILTLPGMIPGVACYAGKYLEISSPNCS